ncbi:peptidase [Flavisphingomonas formosensis]|uniref:peptidase n=1 Tax=Flavisphingomonas formosensis TaxID=861534 RepID=UPI0012FBC00C|nr:peptidase [Sphingomonas formosensis]
MTYCVGMLPEAGLVMIADTRTNAGVDNISVYRKLHMLADGEDRIVVACSAGNLSVTQTLLSTLEEGLPPLEEGGEPRRIAHVATMFRAAQLVSEASILANRAANVLLAGTGIDSSTTLLLGGRIGDGPLELFLIYPEGNFIQCRPDTPFLQIGQTMYGKPILDRVLDYRTPLEETVKVGLISFDGTLRSNLAVGRPLDLIAIPADRSEPVVRRRIAEDDAYFNELSTRWSALLNESRAAIPDPPFMKSAG